METQNNIQSAIEAGMRLAGPQTVDNATAPYALVPNGCHIEALEQFAQHPDRIKADPSFDTVESFVRYVNAFKQVNTRLWGKVKDGLLEIAALMDYHTAPDIPRWADSHMASFVSKFSPNWVRWACFDRKQLQQQVFAEFVEDNLLDVRTPPGAELLEITRTLSTKTKVDFLSSIRLSNGNVQLQYEENTEARAGEKGQLIVPEKFLLGLPVFEDGPLYPLECKLRYRLNGKALTFEFHRVNPELVVKAAAQEILNEVEKQTEIKPFIGLY